MGKIGLNRNAAFEQTLNRSSHTQQRVHTLLSNPELHCPSLPEDRRTQIATALFSLTIKQSWSVTFLFQNGRYDAALALTRSVFEAYCRGSWVKHYAKTKAIETFSSKKFPDMAFLIKKTTSNVLNQDGRADAFFAKVYWLLSDYAHGGLHMLGMQLSEVGIDSNYNPQELQEILMISDMMQILASVELLDFARCRSDEYCRSFSDTHSRCKRFQSDVRLINDLLEAFGHKVNL